MTKTEFVKQLALRLGITQAEADRYLRVFCDVVQEHVAEGNDVSLPGFGRWERRARKARTGRNPQTGEAVAIPERNIPVFTAGKLFKEQVS